MVNRRSVPVVAAVLLGAVPVSAQVSKGTAPPAFDFKKVFNDGPESFDELEGKVVLLDFSATW